jgi:hypothetical protein
MFVHARVSMILFRVSLILIMHACKRVGRKDHEKKYCLRREQTPDIQPATSHFRFTDWANSVHIVKIQNDEMTGRLKLYYTQ